MGAPGVRHVPGEVVTMKVLIADPDWHFAEQASTYLESHAHLVVHQPVARLALAQARHWQPDLVIVAAELAAAGLLESLAAASPRPAVLLVDHMDRFARAWRAWQQGGDELFLKPVLKPTDLHEAIVAALENAAAGLRGRRHHVAASA
jgi:DNA-binding response OmpR family regulator